jgi:hypothetical protein
VFVPAGAGDCLRLLPEHCVTDTAAEEGSGAQRDRAGWLISCLGIAQIGSWGTLYYSFALMAEAMRVDLGWSKTDIYGAATVGLALAGLAAYPVGAAIDRGRGRYVMSGASVAAGLLLIGWSQVSNIVVFYMLFAAIGCLQAATLYAPAFAVIARRLGPGNARRGITTLTLWGGFASTVFIPVIQLLIDGFGWRGALIALGAVNIVVCGGLTFLAIDPARDRPVPVRRPEGPPPLAGRAAVAWAFRRPVFWALVVAVIGYEAAFAALTFHIYPLLLERGLDTASVVSVLAVIGPAQVVGRVLVMIFGANAPVRRLGSLIVAIFPLTVAGFALAPPNVVIIAAIAGVYGAANGIMTIVRGLMVPEMLSREAYGAINGALVAPMNVTQAAAPLAAAFIWSATGDYEAVLIAIGAGTLVLCAGFWAAALLGRPR